MSARRQARRPQSRLFLVSLLLLGLGTAYLLEVRRLDWERAQEMYVAARPGLDQGVRGLRPGYATTTTDGSEYCITCHLSSGDHPPIEGSELFAEHDGVFHEPVVLGCVACHGGDGGSLRDHEESRYGLARPLDGDRSWVSCLHCHDPAGQPEGFVPDFEPALEAQLTLRRMVARNGCLGCHRIVSRGGGLGPTLEEIGCLVASDPTGPHLDVHERVLAQLRDERITQLGSQMPPLRRTSDAEARLMAAFLILNGRIQRGGEGRWVVEADFGTDEPAETYGAHCSGCHGETGEGTPPGERPGGVPAIGSRLFATCADQEYLTALIAEGRPGTLMDGFAVGQLEGRPRPERQVLTREEIDELVGLLRGGELAPEDHEAFLAAASASCAVCHVSRVGLYDTLLAEETAAAFRKHPWRFDARTLARTEGLDMPRDQLSLQSGETLYTDLCSQCHESRGGPPPAARRRAAPRLRGSLSESHLHDALFLTSVIVGRGDAEPSTWRHEGIRGGEYSIEELLAVLEYLRSDATAE